MADVSDPSTALYAREWGRPNVYESIVPGLISHRVIMFALIEAELLLALWLLVGGVSRTRFFIASVCFIVFAIVAGYEAINALPSCGCFGNVKVSPRITAAFDVFAIIALWFTRPQKSDATRPRLSHHRLVGAYLIFVAASAFLWTLYLRRASPATTGHYSDQSGSLVVLEPSTWQSKIFPLIGEKPCRSAR
jgi:hypothetical protein